jgi:CarD family transcriptional regulator
MKSVASAVPDITAQTGAVARRHAPAKVAGKQAAHGGTKTEPTTGHLSRTESARTAEKSAGKPTPDAAETTAPSPTVGAEARAPTLQNGRPASIPRSSNKDETFAEGDYVVYPTHGVGKVDKIAIEDIAGHRLELIHITFEENRMTLRVPVAKARSAGLRKLATRKMFDEALAVLRGRARVKRTMWSRRAQEYEAKINSGDPIAIAEVVRDLHRNAGQPDQSFSERQIYEAAMERMAAELAALDRTDKTTAAAKLTAFLQELTAKAASKDDKDQEEREETEE